jgi:putative Holliday junction resolvase
MRLLAIDHGDKRIGLAVSDESGTYVSPIEVLDVSQDQAMRSIAKLNEEEAIGQVIVGLPLNMDDTLGPQARRVIEFAGKLEAMCGIKVKFVDERLSSFEAEQSINEQQRAGRRLSRQDKKDRRDALAAAVILRGFLDGSLAEIPVSSDS